MRRNSQIKPLKDDLGRNSFKMCGCVKHANPRLKEVGGLLLGLSCRVVSVSGKHCFQRQDYECPKDYGDRGSQDKALGCCKGLDHGLL